MTALPISENFLLMPHFHECTDHPFGLAVGLRPIDPGEFLTNAELGAGCHKCVFTGSFELFTVV